MTENAGWGLEVELRELVAPLDEKDRKRLADALRLIADFVETPNCVRCSNCKKRKNPGAFREGKSVCQTCQWRFGIRE